MAVRSALRRFIRDNNQADGASRIISFKPGDILTGESFTRATTATYNDSAGLVQSAISGTKRDGHFIAGVRTLLLEAARINICLQSSNFGVTWAAVGTPTRSAANLTCGIVNLDLLGDDDGAALEGYTQTITFTGDAVKALSFYVAKGTAVSSVVRVRDTTAAADRLLAAITWVGSVPTLTMTTGTFLRQEALGNSVYRIYVATASVTAANVNSLQFYPATDAALAVAATGNINWGGVQCENATFPSSHIPTTVGSATRNADVYGIPFPSPAREMSIYTKFVDQGTSNGGSLRYWNISDSVLTAAHLFARASSAGKTVITYDPGSGGVSTAALAGSVAVGDTVEGRHVLTAAGARFYAQSINAGAEEVGATAGAVALPAAWSAPTFFFINASAVQGYAAFAAAKILLGQRSMAELRAA